MAHKRTNNGIHPGVRVKTVTGVAMSRMEWGRVGELMERLDATQGCIIGWAAIRGLKELEQMEEWDGEA